MVGATELLLAAVLGMSGFVHDGIRRVYELDVSALPAVNADWMNGSSPLAGWQAFVDSDPVTNLFVRPSLVAPKGGLYLWRTNDFCAIGLHSASERDWSLGCVVENDFGARVRHASLVTQVAQVTAQNTWWDVLTLEYRLLEKDETTIDGSDGWTVLDIFPSPVVDGILSGPLPAYGAIVTNTLPSVPNGGRLALRWVDRSPKSGGNASFAFPVFRLEVEYPFGSAITLR